MYVYASRMLRKHPKLALLFQPFIKMIAYLLTHSLRISGLVKDPGLREIFYENVYERIFRIKRDDVVIDCGAYKGMFTIKAAIKVGSKGVVIAIEPEPNNLRILKMITRGFNNVIIVGKAVGAKREKSRLYLMPFHSSMHSLTRKSKRYIDVPVDTLDNLITELRLKKRKLFIKIDVEGAELDVLKGAKETLASGDVTLAIAAYHYPGESLEISDYLKAKNLTVLQESSFTYASTHVHS